MTVWSEALIAITVALVSSNGLWLYFSKRSDRNDATTKLMLGLAHNQIIDQGMMYLDRGYVTKDEYEDFVKYLYSPYAVFGGNGLAEKIFKEVTSLPIRRKEDDD